MKTHLILISDQAVANFTPVLDERFKPEQVVMLVTDDMLHYSVLLENIYKPRGVKVKRCFIDDAWDVEHIRNKIEALLINCSFDDIALNASGGTKLMSIAAYEVFKENDLAIFFVHPDYDRLIWVNPQRPAVDLADRIKLQEYFLAYGADQVVEKHKLGVAAGLRELTEQIISNIQSFESALASLNYYAATADNKRLASVEISKGLKGDYCFWELVDLFVGAGLLNKDGERLVFPNENARFMANGGWLELYAYACCLNLKKSLGIQDVSRSVEVSRLSGKNTVLNELDVAFLKDNRLYLLECKTKRYSGNSRKHSEASDVLYKLDSITGVLGGLKAKAMLVSFKQLRQHNLDRARELGLVLCCAQDLKFLEERIKNWVLLNKA